ncbi:pseudaminic acid synthase [bacterium]|nr:pseudaminic acid synthase [bacterium]
MRTIPLGRYQIGENHPPFVIAELSGNHNGSLDRALEIVKAAAKAGAHCLKLQTYTADSLTIDCDLPDFRITDPESLWHGRSLYELYQEASTPWEWHAPIFDLCRELGMVPLSTPFDVAAVDFLESLGVEAFKIASFEAVDLALVRRIAQTRKPVIASTGMSTLSEVEEMVTALRTEGNEDLVLLKCTSAYPATAKDANLKTLAHMRDAFGTHVGLSDHTMGIGVAVASVAHGAVVIEKHFTLRRADGGVDSAFSLEPAELQMLVQETKQAWEASGQVAYGPRKDEAPSLRFRRSLYASQDIGAGELFSHENTRVIRPGYGLAPRFHPIILGKKAKTALKKGERITWDVV